MPDGSVLLVEIVARLLGGPNSAAMVPHGRVWVYNNSSFGGVA